MSKETEIYHERICHMHILSGSYFIMVYASGSFTGVSLKAEYTVPTTSATSSTNSSTTSTTTQATPTAAGPPHSSDSTNSTTTSTSTTTQATPTAEGPPHSSDSTNSTTTTSTTTKATPTAAGPPQLTINQPKVGIAMTKGQSLHFRVIVTSLPELFIVTSARSGDVDLYVKRGGPASRSSFDKKSLTNSSDESVYFPAPKAGRNFVFIYLVHHHFFCKSRLNKD